MEFLVKNQNFGKNQKLAKSNFWSKIKTFAKKIRHFKLFLESFEMRNPFNQSLFLSQ